MPSAWIEHIKAFAKANDMTYKDALKCPKCKEEYHKGKEMTGGMVAEKDNISMTIAEKKPRGRPKKYATDEERKKAKTAKTIESNKRKKASKFSTAGAEKLEMAVPDMSVKPKGIVIKPRPAPVEKKTPFEEKAREAMIEYGFNEQEKFWDFPNIIRWKSGKKKGQIRVVRVAVAKMEEQEKWKEEEKARLAKKYGLPKKWNEALREMLGHGEVNDIGYIGYDKWWKTAGNKERHEAREEASGREETKAPKPKKAPKPTGKGMKGGMFPEGFMDGIGNSAGGARNRTPSPTIALTQAQGDAILKAIRKRKGRGAELGRVLSRIDGGDSEVVLRRRFEAFVSGFNHPSMVQRIMELFSVVYDESIHGGTDSEGAGLIEAIKKNNEFKEKVVEALPPPMKRMVRQIKETKKLLDDNKARIIAENKATGSYGGGLLATHSAEDAGGLTHIYPLSRANILEMCKHLI